MIAESKTRPRFRRPLTIVGALTFDADKTRARIGNGGKVW